MRKKVLSLLLVAVMGLSVFAGCSLVKYNQARDNMQVVLTINPVTIEDKSTDAVYVTQKREIRKYELINMMNNLYSQSSTGDMQSMVDNALDYLVTNEIVINEAEAALAFKKVVYGQYEENEVLKNTYQSIDSELRSYKNTVLKKWGYTVTEETFAEEETDSASTTYPTKTEESSGKYDDLDREALVALALDRIEEGLTEIEYQAQKDSIEIGYSERRLIILLERYDRQRDADGNPIEKWTPSEARYPGLYGTDFQKSVEREAFLLFLSALDNLIEEDYRLTDAQRETFRQDMRNLRNIQNSKGLPYVYPEMADTDLIDFLIKDNYVRNAKITLLQESITAGEDITDSEIKAYYDNLLEEQRSKYLDASAYSSDMRDGSVDPILYFRDDSFYFVKHILIPFSDEQTAALSAYKNTKEYDSKGEAGYAAYKNNLAHEIMSYEHVNGEDHGRPLTIATIWNDIKGTVKAASTVTDKLRAFDNLIYKYNTDPGIFDKVYGYAVEKTEGNAIDTQYMAEFSQAAKDLYDNGRGEIGAMSEWAVTDYGIHVLMLTKKVNPLGETIGVNDYQSDAQYGKVSAKLSATLLDSKISAAFDRWQSNQMTIYFGDDSELLVYNDKVIKAFVESLNG